MMMTRFVCLMLLFSASGLTGNLQAQCKKISGLVQDKQTGEGLPGANVRFYNHAATGMVTDASGKFEFESHEGDSLLVSFIGYNDQVIQLVAGCELLIELEASANALQEVTIQSERLIAEEFTIIKIRQLEIYTNPSAKGDPLLAVNSTPSATTTDESANISLRGSSPAETGIFLNNVPINDAVRYAQLNGIGTFSIFNTALISQVQVYPGNPPLEFGNTTSGLIALYTDEVIPKQNQRTLSVTLASIGLYLQQRMSKSSSLTVFSNYQPSAAIRWVNSTALEHLKDFTTIDLGLHFLAKINERTTVKIFNYSNKESFRYQTDEPTFSGIFNQQKARNYTVTNLRHRMGKGELSWNSGISFSKASFSLSTIQTVLRMNDLFTSLNYQYFGNRYELKTGVSYDYRGADFNGVYPRYDFALGEQFPVDSVTQSEAVKVPEGYIYAKYYLSSQWIVGTGLRKNVPTKQQANSLSGQVNINFKPAAAWNIVGSAGQYNKFVPTQGSESSSGHIQTNQYSMDVSFTQSQLNASASLFYKHGIRSGTSFKTSGVEVFGRYRFGNHLSTQLSFTSLNATDIASGKSASTAYDIHYFIRGNAEYKIGGTWTATLAFLFRQGSFYKPVTSAAYHSVGAYEPVYGEDDRLPGYNLIDLSLSKLMIWGEHTTSVAFCGVNNLANFKNVRDYRYNFDYTEKSEDLFSLRTLYFGCIINF